MHASRRQTRTFVLSSSASTTSSARCFPLLATVGFIARPIPVSNSPTSAPSPLDPLVTLVTAELSYHKLYALGSGEHESYCNSQSNSDALYPAGFTHQPTNPSQDIGVGVDVGCEPWTWTIDMDAYTKKRAAITPSPTQPNPKHLPHRPRRRRQHLLRRRRHVSLHRITRHIIHQAWLARLRLAPHHLSPIRVPHLCPQSDPSRPHLQGHHHHPQ